MVGDDDAAPEDKVLGAGDFDHLEAAIHRKIHQKRTLARLPLVLSQPAAPAASSSSSQSQSQSQAPADGCPDPATAPAVSIQMKLVRRPAWEFKGGCFEKAKKNALVDRPTTARLFLSPWANACAASAGAWGVRLSDERVRR